MEKDLKILPGAASPDGISSDNKFIIEIKCPYNANNRAKLNYMDENNKLKKNHNYYFQVQTQLFDSKISMCHFIVYSHIAGLIHVETIFYDEDFMQDCLVELDYFYINVFSREYLKLKYNH